MSCFLRSQITTESLLEEFFLYPAIHWNPRDDRDEAERRGGCLIDSQIIRNVRKNSEKMRFSKLLLLYYLEILKIILRYVQAYVIIFIMFSVIIQMMLGDQ